MPEPTAYPEVTDWLGSEVQHWKGKVREAEAQVERLRGELAKVRQPADQATHERQAEKLAQMFHETYERLAPEHGYKTREASAVPWEDVPAANKSLMIAVASHVYDAYMTTQLQQARAHAADQRARAEQAEDLLRIAHDTSNRSEAERARAVQRAEQAEAERDAAHALLQTALHLRMHGEHAPGGTETWRDWEHATETHLRAALGAPSGADSPVSGQTPANPATTTTPAPTDAQEG